MSEPVTYESLVQEAVAKCGDDMNCIESFIEARLAELPPDVSERIRRDPERLVAFRAPDQSQFDPN